MVTNAYLLNEENRAKFKKWHLKHIQVSIDGLGEEYNHMRKYTGNDPNPFETVMNNLKQAMDTTDVKITLRVNVSMDNIDTIPDLLGYIQERFKENLDNGSLRRVYVAGIYQITQDPYGRLPEGYQEKMDLFEKDFPYIWHIEEEEKGVIRKGNLSHCSANFGTSLAISADGKLMPCEHYTDEEIIGDVVNGVTNHDVEKSWVTMHGENNVFCLENKCPVLPICKHFYKCPLKKTCSTQERMKSKIESVEKSVKTTFKFYLKKKEELENS
jgi:radical SAM protein with 4Fe4S-binding SPASM domain